MRHQFIGAASALLLMTGFAAAQAADSGPVVQNSRAMAAADDAGMGSGIRQQIQDQMTKAGYTDVNVAPVSFMVRAKDKQGNPVAMVIGPDSFTEVTEMAPKPATAPAPAAPAKPAGSATTAPAKP